MKNIGAPIGNKNTLGKHWKVKDTSKMHHSPWNKGIPMSEEAKQKMITKKIGKPSGKKDKILSEKSRRKLSEAHIGQKAWNKNKECPQLSGENHWNWQGGKTSKTKKRLNTLAWKKLRKVVYEKDNWSCRYCGKHCYNDIQCHHIESGNDDLDKLITLCKACHLRLHHVLRRADITTKFNTLLTYVENLGFNATT